MLNVWEGWTAVSTQQTSDCNLTLILNVSIINPLPDGRLCGNTWLICFSFYPQFFLYTSKTTTVIWDSKHPCPVSSYSTWNPLHCDSCDHSLGGRSKMRGTKSWIFNSKAPTKKGNQASKRASPALISELTMHRFIATAGKLTLWEPQLLTLACCSNSYACTRGQQCPCTVGPPAMEQLSWGRAWTQTHAAQATSVCSWTCTTACLTDSSATVKAKIVIWDY